jgi:hypothetical protein
MIYREIGELLGHILLLMLIICAKFEQVILIL